MRLVAAMSAGVDNPASYDVQSYEEYTVSDCMADPLAYGSSLVVKSHLRSCAGQHMRTVVWDCVWQVTCVEVAWVPDSVTTIGYTMVPGIDPRAVLMASVTEWGVPQGPEADLVLALTVRLTVRCTPLAPATTCQSDVPQGYSKSVGEWMTFQGTLTFTLSSPVGEGSGNGPDNLANYSFDTFSEVVGGYDPVTFARGQFRCDYAARGMNPTNNLTGCVFPNPRGYETFKRLAFGDSTIVETVNHISDAFTSPTTTLPPASAKRIPGSVASGFPLSRVTLDKVITANRRKSSDACSRYDPNWPNRAVLDLQCDEFPFASTYEGAASNAFDFSARMIRRVDNAAAGQILNGFYQTYRILDGDYFWVELRPAAP